MRLEQEQGTVRRASFTAVLALVAGALAAPADAQQLRRECGNLTNAYGPYNYVNISDFREKLPRVERHHFMREIEQLQADRIDGGAAAIGRNIDYTLRAFPNHHRALDAMGRWGVMTAKNQPPGSRYTVDCWFDRAIAYQPTDGVVRMLYGIFRTRMGHYERAVEQYQVALQLAPDNSELHYNMGITLTKMKRFEDAVPHARRAYELGFPLPGLKRKLIVSGHWTEPTAATGE